MKAIKRIWANFLEAQITHIVVVEDTKVKLGIASEPAELLAQYSFPSLRYSEKRSILAKNCNLYTKCPNSYLRGHISVLG